MAYLEENEWMLLNEVAYNISFIYTVEEMQDEILNRWLPLLIDCDAGIFSRLSRNRDGDYLISGTASKNLSPEMTEIWKECSEKADATRWIIYSAKNAAFRESDMLSEDGLRKTESFRRFYLPNRLRYAAGLCVVFREEPVGIVKLYRSEEKGDFTMRDLFVLDQLQKHFAYRLYYEAKKGDTRYFFAKGYHEKMCRRYNLTEREGELFNYAIQGFSNEDIARKMNISVHTVKKHFHSIYSKMDVKNRVQLLQCLPLSTSKINFDEL